MFLEHCFHVANPQRLLSWSLKFLERAKLPHGDPVTLGAGAHMDPPSGGSPRASAHLGR